MQIDKNTRKDIDPNMVKLTEISTPKESAAIMRNFHKVRKEALPDRSKSFMEISSGGIRKEIIEPDSVVTEIKVTT